MAGSRKKIQRQGGGGGGHVLVLVCFSLSLSLSSFSFSFFSLISLSLSLSLSLPVMCVYFVLFRLFSRLKQEIKTVVAEPNREELVKMYAEMKM